MPSAFRRNLFQLMARTRRLGVGVMVLLCALVAQAQTDVQPVTPTFRTITLAEALQDIDRRLDEKIAVDWEALSRVGIRPEQTLNLRFTPDTSARQALQMLLRALSQNDNFRALDWREDNGVIRISTRQGMSLFGQTPAETDDPPASPAARAPLSGETINKLQTFLTLDMADVELHALFKHLAETLDLDVFVNWPALGRAGITRDQRVSIKCTDVPLRAAFDLLFKVILGPRAGEPLGWTMYGDVVHVSAQRTLDDPPFITIAPEADNEHVDGPAMNSRLDQVAPVTFDGIALVTAFERMKSDVDTPLYVNWQALTAVGVDSHQTVHMQLSHASVRTALELLLLTVSSAGAAEPIGYAVCPDVIYVDTVSRLKRQFVVTREYVLPAAFDPIETQRLLINIRRLGHPKDWTYAGGDLSKASLSGSGHLIVRACPGVHAKVQRLVAGESLAKPKPLDALRAEPADDAIIIEIDERGRMAVGGEQQQWIKLRAMILEERIKRVILRPAPQTPEARVGAIERTIRSALRPNQALLIESGTSTAAP